MTVRSFLFRFSFGAPVGLPRWFPIAHRSPPSNVQRCRRVAFSLLQLCLPYPFALCLFLAVLVVSTLRRSDPGFSQPCRLVAEILRKYFPARRLAGALFSPRRSLCLSFISRLSLCGIGPLFFLSPTRGERIHPDRVRPDSSLSHALTLCFASIMMTLSCSL